MLFGSQRALPLTVKNLLIAPGGPLSFMRLAQINGWVYRMNDVEENGKLVETTMVAPSFTAYGGKLTWYRSPERCGQALSKLRKAQELEQRKLEKYR